MNTLEIIVAVIGLTLAGTIGMCVALFVIVVDITNEAQFEYELNAKNEWLNQAVYCNTQYNIDLTMTELGIGDEMKPSPTENIDERYDLCMKIADLQAILIFRTTGTVVDDNVINKHIEELLENNPKLREQFEKESLGN